MGERQHGATDAGSEGLLGRRHGQPEPQQGRGHPRADLKDVTCTKNPGHAAFTPACSFTIDHLPDNLGEPWRLEWLLSLVDLTVKVSVKRVSKNRPPTYPDSPLDPYPHCVPDGGFSERSGSGFVSEVIKRGEGGVKSGDYRSCGCLDCGRITNPKKVWWEVMVITAAHVVFDTEECQDTTVRFFFDHKDSVIHEASGHAVKRQDIVGDWCAFTVCIHEQAIAKRLEKAKNRHFELRDRHQKDDDIYVISHPHGCSKQISIGKQVGKGAMWKQPLRHQAATCPGSSGGMVVARGNVGTPGDGLIDWGAVMFAHSEDMRDGTSTTTRGWLS